MTDYLNTPFMQALITFIIFAWLGFMIYSKMDKDKLRESFDTIKSVLGIGDKK